MATIETRWGRDGSATYRARIRLFGRPAVTKTFNRKTDARTWAEQIESDLRRGRQAPLAEAMRRTLAQLVDRYIDETLPAKGRKTEKNFRAYLRWWKAEIGDYTLANVTPALISECRKKLHSTPARYGRARGPASVNRYLAALSTCLTTAVAEYEWIEANPMLGKRVRKFKEPKGRVRFLSDDERRYLLEACEPQADLYAVVLLALSTGARQGEILGIRCADIDLSRAAITLHDTKNGDRRVLSLAGPALEVMRERMKVRRIDNDRVFLHPKKKDKPLDISASWYKALDAARAKYMADCKKAKQEPVPAFLENFRFHDLRHSAASYLAMNGATLAEIAEILGHRTLAMVKRYAHLTDAHVSKVVARMNAAVFGGPQ
jgi:integrase